MATLPRSLYMFSMYFLAASALACDDGDGAEVATGGAAALVDASSPLGAEAGRDPPPRTDARRFSHMAPPRLAACAVRASLSCSATGALKRHATARRAREPRASLGAGARAGTLEEGRHGIKSAGEARPRPCQWEKSGPACKRRALLSSLLLLHGVRCRRRRLA